MRLLRACLVGHSRSEGGRVMEDDRIVEQEQWLQRGCRNATAPCTNECWRCIKQLLNEWQFPPFLLQVKRPSVRLVGLLFGHARSADFPIEQTGNSEH